MYALFIFYLFKNSCLFILSVCACGLFFYFLVFPYPLLIIKFMVQEINT